jgi:hypothetical protein
MRVRAPEEWIENEAPELRIIPQCVEGREARMTKARTKRKWIRQVSMDSTVPPPLTFAG